MAKQGNAKKVGRGKRSPARAKYKTSLACERNKRLTRERLEREQYKKAMRDTTPRGTARADRRIGLQRRWSLLHATT